MKTHTDHSRSSGLYEQLRQQIGILSKIHSFPATNAASQPDMNKATAALKPALIYEETGNSAVLNPGSDEGSIIQTVKGVVRSFVFFNWKDHA